MRGSTDFTVMKGFMDDFTIKGGESAETLPPDRGHDVTDEEKLSNKADGKGPNRGNRKTNEDDITFDKDVSLVKDKAKGDIKDGYVNDIQGEKVSNAKGYDTYNKLVSKGMIADVSFNPYNVSDSIRSVQESAGLTMKELGSKKMDASGYSATGAKDIPVGKFSSTGTKAGKLAKDVLQKVKNNPKLAAGIGAAGLLAGGAGVYAATRKTPPEQKGFDPEIEKTLGSEKMDTSGYSAGGAKDVPIGKFSSTGAKAEDYLKRGKAALSGTAGKVGGYVKTNPVKSGLIGAGALGAAGLGTYLATRKNKEEEKGFDLDEKKK